MNFLVTGCSRGVGLEICRALLQQGHIVYGVARSYTNEFKFLETEYAGRVFFKSIDLSDSENVRKTVFREFIHRKRRQIGAQKPRAGCPRPGFWKKIH